MKNREHFFEHSLHLKDGTVIPFYETDNKENPLLTGYFDSNDYPEHYLIDAGDDPELISRFELEPESDFLLIPKNMVLSVSSKPIKLIRLQKTNIEDVLKGIMNNGC